LSRYERRFCDAVSTHIQDVAPQSYAPDLARALKRLREARMMEVEALGEIITAIAPAGTPNNGLKVSQNGNAALPGVSEGETLYLSVKQLAERVPYAEQTIRNLMLAGELVEGRHFFKRRGRVIFSWPAMRRWVEERGAEGGGIPLVRNRHGRQS
jgi:hypothetical protein